MCFDYKTEPYDLVVARCHFSQHMLGARVIEPTGIKVIDCLQHG